MKKSVYVIALLIALVGNPTNAQENSEVNYTPEVNTASTYRIAKYQYLPNLEAYYNKETSEYIFKNNGEWKVGKEIPNGYRGYSIYNGYRVDITDYSGDKPYEKLSYHKKQFPYYSNDRRGKLAALKAKRLSETQLATSE